MSCSARVTSSRLGFIRRGRRFVKPRSGISLVTTKMDFRLCTSVAAASAIPSSLSHTGLTTRFFCDTSLRSSVLASLPRDGQCRPSVAQGNQALLALDTGRLKNIFPLPSLTTFATLGVVPPPARTLRFDRIFPRTDLFATVRC